MRLSRPSIIAGLALLVATIACGGGGGDSGPIESPPSAIVAVSSSSAGSVLAGSATALTLVVKVADASGHGVSGKTVSWNTSSGSITPGSSTTDGSGQSSSQWTPGTSAGSQTATAAVSGVAGAATFTATVTAGALAKLKLTPDTVKLATVGAIGQVTTTGADAFDNAVTASGITFTMDDPTIASVSSSGLVTAKAVGTTFVRATSGSATGSSVVSVKKPPCFGVTAGLNLSIGQVTTLTGPAAAEFCLQGAAGAEFVAIPFSSPATGATLSLTFDPVNTTIASGPPNPTVLAPNILSGSRLRTTILSGGRELVRDEAWEARFRERSIRELTPMIPMARATMRQSSSSGLRRSLSFAVQSVGDLIDLNVSLDACMNATIHTGRVMAVSNNAIVVNDTLNPAGGFTTADFEAVASAFDGLVVPVDTTNFGAPTDIDHNDHVILFFTTAVNQLTPRNSSFFIGGFFYGRDLFPKTMGDARAGQCQTSNYAEMFYLLAPDPSGTINGNRWSVSQVKTLTVGTVAHEFQHLINASRHLYVNTNTTAFEDVFLDEGLAHMAEELTFYRASGLSPRSNLGVSSLQASQGIRDAADNYQTQNMRRFREHLKTTETSSPYAPNDSLATRGATWSFLRYAADRSTTTPESSIWRAIVNVNTTVNGESPVGLDNLARVFGSDLFNQIRDWAVANYTDDAVSGVPAVDTHPSWQERSIETYVNTSTSTPGTTYPLPTRSLDAQVVLALIDGGAAYLRFGVGAGSVGGAGVTTSGTLTSTFSLTIVRTQ